MMNIGSKTPSLSLASLGSKTLKPEPGSRTLKPEPCLNAHLFILKHCFVYIFVLRNLKHLDFTQRIPKIHILYESVKFLNYRN